MSTFIVDNLKGKTTANTMTVLAGHAADSTTTTNLEQGLTKMWCCWDGDDNPPTINDSFNVTNFTDNSTADIDINFTSNFNTVHYSFMSQSESTFNSSEDAMVIAFYDSGHKNTHDIRCVQASAKGGANGECPDNSASAQGDLA
tara:strand:+ start:399 stop:830 length:432 start_codon:yes stop_codon:yes gene_type:complete